MKKWTWQWLILLAILGMLFSCDAWIDRQPYDIYEDVYKPDRPWKQMIWKASAGELSSYRASREVGAPKMARANPHYLPGNHIWHITHHCNKIVFHFIQAPGHHAI
jgi:hypothetical protein